MTTNIQTIVSHRPGMIITKTIVDGDTYKITEEYTDDDGFVVYVREYDFSPGQLLKAQNNGKKKDAKKDIPKAKKQPSKFDKKLEKNRKRK